MLEVIQSLMLCIGVANKMTNKDEVDDIRRQKDKEFKKLSENERYKQSMRKLINRM